MKKLEKLKEEVKENILTGNSRQSKKNLVMGVVAFLILCAFGYCGFEIYSLQKQISAQQAEIENSRKVYVYNLEEVLKGINILETKKKFEDEIIKLNDEVFATEKKIKSIKDEKMKEELSGMYLKNLKMKRDDLMEKYQNDIKELTDKVNAVISELAKEKDVSVIFVQNAIAVNTPYVVDLTAEILTRVKNK